MKNIFKIKNSLFIFSIFILFVWTVVSSSNYQPAMPDAAIVVDSTIYKGGIISLSELQKADGFTLVFANGSIADSTFWIKKYRISMVFPGMSVEYLVNSSVFTNQVKSRFSSLRSGQRIYFSEIEIVNSIDEVVQVQNLAFKIN